MNEEEKGAIETVQGLKVYDDECLIDTLINLVEKQQKELNNIKEIEKSHKEENGKLRAELEQEKEKNKELEKVIARLEEDVEGYSGLAKQIQEDYSKQ